LAAQIASAITDAILIYQKERFRFSEATFSNPRTFNTVIGQGVYTSTALADIGTLEKIDFLNIQIGNAWFPLHRYEPETVLLYNEVNTMSGQPIGYAYMGNQLILSPVPSGIYPMQLGGFFIVPAPATDDEVGNPWMTDAERLIRARAKYEIAVHVTRNAALAAEMSPDPGPNAVTGREGAARREWRALKGEANRLASLGRVRSVQF
jgi:hypothetical protein